MPKLTSKTPPAEHYIYNEGAQGQLETDGTKDNTALGKNTLAYTILEPEANEVQLKRTPNWLYFQKYSGNPIVAAGNTAVWVPAAGKRIRLMGYSFSVPSTTTTVAGNVAFFYDAGNGATIGCILALGTTTTNLNHTVMFPGNGYLQSQSGTLLVNLSAAYTAGGLWLNLYGTEEL